MPVVDPQQMGQQIREQQDEGEEQDIQDIPQLLIPGGNEKNILIFESGGFPNEEYWFMDP